MDTTTVSISPATDWYYLSHPTPTQPQMLSRLVGWSANQNGGVSGLVNSTDEGIGGIDEVSGHDGVFVHAKDLEGDWGARLIQEMRRRDVSAFLHPPLPAPDAVQSALWELAVRGSRLSQCIAFIESSAPMDFEEASGAARWAQAALAKLREALAAFNAPMPPLADQ